MQESSPNKREQLRNEILIPDNREGLLSVKYLKDWD